ncbi:oligopeptide/dipeptide ABC transporter ATP-binding protein [Marivita sp. GX14005]|uniref:ABC transporter ATP-binding protein n=1 Tax=Marivita sp. GX14005 TaxID=2942276 RepID=UPI002018CEB0|nr:oligopeptide/dipeptide ABC transporter ATP-binding protein [Marivita sp. GX14005]MCL3883333.1 ATP-binding cassette domain-containing protein [Marivita sp. GX14005]
MTAPVLELNDLSRVFARRDGWLDRMLNRAGLGKPPERLVAVDGVSLSLRDGEMLGVVGESGCGKSTLGRMAAQLLPASGGEVRFRGRAISDLPRSEARDARRNIQMVFQNPYASLNPSLSVGDAIMEAPLTHGLVRRREIPDRLASLLSKVGLSPEMADRFPHELSGGQRQRVGIARALAVSPEVIIFDEAVAALDVSVQAQILNLLADLKEQGGFSSIFISHDLNVVRFISDRIAILYLGRLVELADRDTVFARPHHPYTRALLSEVPVLGAARRRFTPLKGELPSPLSPPPGCHFHPRCPFAQEICRRESPRLREVQEAGGTTHLSACHFDLPQPSPEAGPTPPPHPKEDSHDT